LLSSVLNRAHDLLYPSQIGIAVKGAVEAGVLAWKSLDHSSPIIGLKVDFSNAFNCVNRSAILKAVATHLPPALPFITWCYSSPSILLWNGQQILSSEGTQQGDPLGPLLFCLVLLSISQSITTQVPDLSLHFWYMDDGNLAGPPNKILQAWHIIQDLAPQVGLQLNPRKSELILFNNEVNDDILNLGLCIHQTGNFDVLGAPIGNLSHCISWCKDKVFSKASPLLLALPTLRDPHIAYLLLRFCISFCKMVFFLRTVSPGYLDSVCEEFDNACLSTLAKILPFNLPALSLNIAQLKIKHGELGLRSTKDHQLAAYLSATSVAKAHISIMVANPTPLVNDSHFTAFNSLVSPEHHIFKLDSPTKQFSLSSLIEDIKVFAKCPDVRFKALLNSTSAKWANSWILTPPISALGLCLTPQEWSFIVAYRLNIPIFKPNSTCPKCAASMDIYGNHALNCNKGGHWIRRHHAILTQLIKGSIFFSLSAAKTASALYSSERW